MEAIDAFPESFRVLMQSSMKDLPERTKLHIYYARRYLLNALGDMNFVGNELFHEIRAEIVSIENDEEKVARISGYAFFLYVRELERLGSQTEAVAEPLPEYNGLSGEEPRADYLNKGEFPVVHNGFVHLREADKAECAIAISHFQQFYPESYNKFKDEKPSLASRVL